MQFKRLWKNKFGSYSDIEPVVINDKVVWETMPPVPFADITQVCPVPSDDKGEIVQDLQCGSSACFTSMLHVRDGKKFIVLWGNGWKDELGFPYADGVGYPDIGGKTCENLLKQAEFDQFDDWDKVFSGNLNDLYLSP